MDNTFSFGLADHGRMNSRNWLSLGEVQCGGGGLEGVCVCETSVGHGELEGSVDSPARNAPKASEFIARSK